MKFLRKFYFAGILQCRIFKRKFYIFSPVSKLLPDYVWIRPGAKLEQYKNAVVLTENIRKKCLFGARLCLSKLFLFCQADRRKII